MKTKLGAEGSNNLTMERKKYKQGACSVLFHCPLYTMDHPRKMSWKTLSKALPLQASVLQDIISFSVITQAGA